jgi:hypothetical protein
MGFLQKLNSDNKIVYSEVRNINFITYNREKTGSFLHTIFGYDRMIHVDLEPQAIANIYRGVFVKTVCTRKNDQEDNSTFYKFHAWLNTTNIVFMRENEIFQNMSDVKFIDGVSLIVCVSPIEIIRGLSQLKNAMKDKKNEKANRK